MKHLNGIFAREAIKVYYYAYLQWQDSYLSSIYFCLFIYISICALIYNISIKERTPYEQ